MSDLHLGGGAKALVIGFGVTGQAMWRALSRRGFSAVIIDDKPSDSVRQMAREGDLELVVAPDAAALEALVSRCDVVLPTPGLADAHPVFAAARAKGKRVMSEFDLARQWDQRPIVAITGTNGKTTVTTLVTEIFRAGGSKAESVGNTDVPLVEAIDNPETEVFVVEASSFRLGHSAFFAPQVATWLNFDPDHLDVHASLDAYISSKAAIFRDQSSDQTAVANAEDEVVMAHATGAANLVTFGLNSGDNRVHDGAVMVDGDALLELSDLRRAMPHDVTNALAAATTALAGGATRAGAADAIASFEGLAHRVSFVGEARGVRWYDDSKATTPHAVLAAIGAFESAVLIAGGRNKGVNLSPLAGLAPRLRGVVAIGEATAEIEAAFDSKVKVVTAADMESAVSSASSLARAGDAVVLSPGCASFDWYANYQERGDHFIALVKSMELDRP